MRQAGLKPKSHNSGVYWIRAHGGGGKGGNENDENNEQFMRHKNKKK